MLALALKTEGNTMIGIETEFLATTAEF